MLYKMFHLQIEELDVYSEDGGKFILAECTVRILQRSKILKSARKRNSIAKEKNVNKTDVDTYLMYMIEIDDMNKDEFQRVAEEYNVILICLGK